MSQSIKSWEDDVERLGNFTEALGPGYSQAFKSSKAAWFNRDQRAAALGHVRNTLDALKSINTEMQAPETVMTHERRAVKTLFGETAERRIHNPSAYNDLYAIKRQVDGFVTAQHGSINPSDVRRVKSAIIDFVNIYQHSSVDLRQSGSNAVKAIDMAQQFAKDERRAVEAWKRVSHEVDVIGATVGQIGAPSGYKTQLGGSAAENLSAKAEALNDIFNEKPFCTPAELLPRAVAAAKGLALHAQKHYDPRVARLTGDIYTLLSTAQRSSNKNSVKALFTAGWATPEINNPTETALNQLAELESHLRSL